MTVTWGKHAGAILFMGDSTCLGSVGGTGGYRPATFTQLASDGWQARAVGSVSNNGLCFAIAGTSLVDFYTGGAHPLDAEITAQRPFILMLTAVYNDWRAGDGVGGPVSQATVRTRMETVISQAAAVAPWLRIVIPQCLTSGAGDTAAWPNADRAAYAAATAAWNSTTGPAIAAATTASGTPCVFCGPYASEPTKSDFVHPVDTAGGYPVMVAPIVAAIEAIKPR